MPFTCTADPEQLSILTGAFNNYCLKYEVPEKDREVVAGMVLELYGTGVASLNDLDVALCAVRQRRLSGKLAGIYGNSRSTKKIPAYLRLLTGLQTSQDSSSLRIRF